jgi:serine/threonine protein kinase
MDHQGAGFAFDSNMDFSNMFAATPGTLFKPADNTSGFFFADEGIDTTASSFIDPTTLGTPQQGAYDMNIQPTANYFPQTPATQFLDAMPTQYNNAYGKRPLQLEADDFPQSKRQATYDFPLFPTPPTTTASSWALEPTPSTTTVEGLSDEAADVCATWFTKYNVLPGDRHIDSLSQLTGESADAIRSWFGQLLKQGMGKGGPSDSAYKSQTAHIQQQSSFWDDHTYQTELLQASPHQPLQILAEDTTPEVSFNQETTVSATAQPVATTRSCKKRCTPTDDLELLARDPRKIYQCTRKCGKRYGRKNDWKRKEEEGYPCKSWVCSLCISEGVENVKPCYRKYHFVQHFRNIHADVDPEDYEEASIVYSETEFPRKCGFCRHRFASRQERIDHIADHFKQGKCMLDWRDDDENNDVDDSTDDDNDDRPSGDGFDGSPSSQPPPFHPGGGSDSNSFGGQGSSGGPAGQPPQSGFFHFQLSQLGESQRYCAVQPTKLTTPSPNISQSSISPDCGGTFPADEFAKQQCQLNRHNSAKGDYENALAGDAFAQSVMTDNEASMEELLDARGLEHTCATNDAVSFETEVLHSASTPSLSQPEAMLDDLIKGEDIGTLGLLPDMTTTTHSQRNNTTDQAPSSLSMSLIPLSRAFHSIKLLGAGGFSTVDEVRHQQTGLRIVRKTLKNRNQTALDELKKEVNVLQKLRHPHIIRFLGAYSKGDKMSILLSPVAETTLAVWLDKSAAEQPANLFETIVKMFGCLASSVRYLHEQRPVVKHMDIKPQNILVVEGDREFPHVILCDFGVSSAEDRADDQSRPWTRQYIAPEVFEGFARKQAADIWSLGCVFAEMASIPLSQDNELWMDFSKTFGGRSGTYYWQDVPGVQKKLTALAAEANRPSEKTVVRMLLNMLSAQPDERPDASSLTKVFTPAPCCLNWPNDKTIFPGPHEEFHEVEKIGKQHGIDLHDQNAIDRTASATIAKTWLDDCLCTHGSCRHLSMGYPYDLPKRLIDILPEGQPGSYVRIIKSDSLETATQDVQYVALSHVWTHAEPILSSDSQSRMQTELGLEQLPVAVRNAISQVQQLGFRYCWLDSLCVLQDSEQEKEQECTSMSSTFRNAVLTVVLEQLAGANAITHPVPGLQDLHTVTSPVPSFTPDVDSNPIATRLPASALLPADILAAPNLGWDTRAWALQDRLLSRRFLHLGEQAYWECNSLKASETFPQGLPALLWEKTHTQCSEDELRPQNPALTSFCRVRQNKTSTFGKIPSCPRALGLNATRPPMFNKTPLWHPTPASLLDATTSATSEPHLPLPSASRLRNCQWIKKQGDDAGQGTEAVQATLNIHNRIDCMASSDHSRCTCCSSSENSSSRQAIGSNGNGHGNGHGSKVNANANTNGNRNRSVAARFAAAEKVGELGYKGSGGRTDDDSAANIANTLV